MHLAHPLRPQVVARTRAVTPDWLVLALLAWAAAEPWALGVPRPGLAAVAAVIVALPLLVRRRAPGAAAVGTLAAVLVQHGLETGVPSLHAPVAAALLAGHALGGLAARRVVPGILVVTGFLAAGHALGAVGVDGWAGAMAQTHLTFAGVVLGGFAIAFFPRHRANRAAALREEITRLEGELAAELRAAGAAERTAIAAQLEALVAGMAQRSARLGEHGQDRAAAARALDETQRSARQAVDELRRLIDVLDTGGRDRAEPAVAPRRLTPFARVVRFHARFGPVVAFAAIGVVEQLLAPARPAEVAPGVLVPAPPYPLAVAVALAVVTALPFVLRTRAPLVAVTAIGALLVARTAAGDLSSLTWSQNAVGVGLAFAAGAFAGSRPRSLAGLAVAGAATSATWALEQVPVSPFEWVYLAVLLAGAWTAGRHMGPHVSAVARGDDELAALRARRATLADEAARFERARLAREVHDLVGHGLSLMSMYAAVSAARLERGVEPVDTAVQRVRALAAATERELEALQATLRAPRDDVAGEAEAHLRALHALADDARRHGQPVALETGDLRVEPEVARAVVEVVREGLTNARKHAGEAPVRVTVLAEAGEVRLEVVNERGAPLLGPGSRRGLLGLGARLEPLRGELDAGPTADGGWRLCCRLPC